LISTKSSSGICTEKHKKGRENQQRSWVTKDMYGASGDQTRKKRRGEEAARYHHGSATKGKECARTAAFTASNSRY
jgi:hypothetical protein